MITALDHIAIAVPDFDKAIKRFMEDFGLTFDGTEDVVAAKTSTAFFPYRPPRLNWCTLSTVKGRSQAISRRRAGGCITCASARTILRKTSHA